jgi:hypothetical protein
VKTTPYVGRGNNEQGAKFQTKHNNGLPHGTGEPLQCKQSKKVILLRLVDNTPYEVEL